MSETNIAINLDRFRPHGRMIDKQYACARPASDFLDHIMGWCIPVLDHGMVQVMDYMGNDSSIVQAARVSYGIGTTTVQSDHNLIRYLIEHKHTSPIEQCSLKLHVKLPIFIARQWIRHRTAKVNEYSGRYSIMTREFYIPSAEQICAQSTSNKQGRGDELTDDQKKFVMETLLDISETGFTQYDKLVDPDGDIRVAKELARIGLSLNTYTEWFWTIDLHNLFHFLNLRLHPHAQYEIRAYADVILEIVKGWVPSAAGAFENFILNGQSFSAPGIQYIQNCAVALLSGTIPEVPVGMSRREKARIDSLMKQDQN